MILPVRSCGILLYRRGRDGALVWIGHMGGPYWARKDAAAWSIPKGEPLEAESDLDAALREFAEEIGQPAPDEEYERLGDFRQPSGKVVTVFAGHTDAPVGFVASNDFELEWPPHSGRIQRFPEIDRAEWVPRAEAEEKMVKGQRAVLDALDRLLA